MTNEYLFHNIDYDDDPEWVVKEFFNSLNLYGNEKFIWGIEHIINKIGFIINETGCCFPDWFDSDPEGHFEGIKFIVYAGETIVSEKIGFKYVRLACEKYIKLHSKDKVKIDELLAKMPM